MEGNITIELLNESIQTLKHLNNFETNPEVKKKNENSITTAMNCIQRIRLAQLLALEQDCLMTIVQSN